MSHSMCSIIAVGLMIAAGVSAAGLTQHQFMAEFALEQGVAPHIAEFLSPHTAVLMNGGSFVDAGYAAFNSEMSNQMHRTSFISAFAAHVRSTYSPPFTGHERLLAFVMGTASHVANDGPYHSGFVAAVADHDFNGDYDVAHTMCDTGLEFLTLTDFDRWWDLPCLWLPVDDIAAAFQRLGYSHPEQDMIRGNMVLGLAAYLERMVARAVDGFVISVMPWGAENYYGYPDGGLLNGACLTAAYYEDVWNQVHGGPGVISRERAVSQQAQAADQDVFWELARRCLDEQIVAMDWQRLPDGSVLINPPRIIDQAALDRLLATVVN